MNFDEIVAEVADRAGLTSTDAITRIGKRVNRRYRRLSTSIGLIAFRRIEYSFTVTPGLVDQTLNGEKILSIKLDTGLRPLDAVTFDEMESIIPAQGPPGRWAVKTQGASTAVIRFDSSMDDGQDLLVQAEDVGSTLSGAMVPAYPESWHDILVWGALADEYLKKEKALANDAEARWDRLLGELRLHLAANGWLEQVQGKNATQSTMAGGSGSASGGGAGTVTHSTGGLTAAHLILGNGGADIRALAGAGTTSQVLHGNAAGDPSFGPILESDVSGLVADLAAKAPLASPALTGVPTAPTAAPGTNTTQVATTAFATTGLALKADVASPTLTGDPKAPTAAIGDNDTSIATTAFVKAVRETVVALVDGATPALDASLGTVFTLSAGGNRTIAVPTNPRDGQKIIIRHQAGAGSNRTLSLNTGAGGFRFGSDVTALTVTVTPKWDYIGCVYNATDSKWDVVAYIKGF